MTESQINNPVLSREPQPQSINVEIQRIYVKEQSCKVSHDNQAFQIKGQPKAEEADVAFIRTISLMILTLN